MCRRFLGLRIYSARFDVILAAKSSLYLSWLFKFVGSDLHLVALTMPEEHSQDHYETPPADRVYEVPSDSARNVLTNRLRGNLLSVKMRNTDKFNDKTRNLLQQHGHLIPVVERLVIKGLIDESV